MGVVATVAGIDRYPVKSLQGETLTRATLGADGIEGDRRFAFRDLDDGRIASAKQPRPWRALLDLTASSTAAAERGTVVTATDGRRWDLDDPALCEAITAATGRAVEVVEASAGVLGSYRSTWPAVDGISLVGAREFNMALSTEAVRFVDVAGLHLITTATLDQLARTGATGAVDARRFRPNLVFATGPGHTGFVEDTWVGAELRIGATARIRITTPTPRCVMTTLAQPALEHDAGVLRAAATNRRVFHELGTLACAGTYAEVITPGPIRVGDEVSLT